MASGKDSRLIESISWTSLMTFGAVIMTGVAILLTTGRRLERIEMEMDKHGDLYMNIANQLNRMNEAIRESN